MSHDTLQGHIHTNFYLMFDAKLSLESIENMLPWERQVYIGLYMNELKRKREEHQKQAAKMR
jgi:hypothetical protein